MALHTGHSAKTKKKRFGKGTKKIPTDYTEDGQNKKNKVKSTK